MVNPEIKARLDKLLDSERMSEMRGALMMLNVVDIADYMDELDKGRMLKVYRILPKDISADVFAYLSDEQKQKLMESIGDSETAQLISDMFIDDAVDFLEELPANLVRRVLANVNEDMLLDARKNDSRSLFGKEIVVNVDKWVDDFDTMKIGNMELLFIYTPGHTKGGMCILVDGNLFSGDTLFRYSIGRTDFYGGSWPQLEKSIKEKLYTLPDETLVLPGHMGFTTIGDEKKGNPFVR